MTAFQFDLHDPTFLAAATRIIKNKVTCHPVLGHRSADDQERAKSDLQETLLIEMQKYDPARASLATYIERVVESDIKDWLKKETRRVVREEWPRRNFDVDIVAISASGQTNADARIDLAARLSAEAGTGAQAIAMKLDGQRNSYIALQLVRPESSVRDYFRSLRPLLPGYGNG